MNKIKRKNKIIGMLLFIIYLILLIYFLFFAEAFGRADSGTLHSYNLEPFKEIRRFYIYRDKLGYSAFVINVFGNILAFVPFGFFRPLIGRRRHSFTRTVFQGFVITFFIEVLQLISNVGSFDVDDIFLNTLGCIMGYILFLVFYMIYDRRGKDV